MVAGVLYYLWLYQDDMAMDLQLCQIAILNANYIAASLDSEFNVLYKGENGRVAHELISNVAQSSIVSMLTLQSV